MKCIIGVIFIMVLNCSALFGQVRGEHAHHFFLDLDFKAGALTQKYNTIPLAANYTNVLNAAESPLKFTNGRLQSYNMQLGYYFNKKRNIALSVGCSYQVQQGNLSIDTFHVEYQATDYQGDVFRQLVTANNGVHESIQTTNISIPVLLKYRLDLSAKLFCTMDAGVMFNIQSQNAYATSTAFDYEAIYDIGGAGTNLTYTYDNAPEPGGEDWLITKKEFMKDNPTGNIQAYFNSLKNVGYNVGLNESVTNKTGTVNYTTRSMGYLLQPAINFRVTDNTILKIGGYYLSQSFNNTEKQNRLLLTTQAGSYASLLNYTTNVQSVSYGITLGISFYFNSYVDKTYDHYFNYRYF